MKEIFGLIILVISLEQSLNETLSAFNSLSENNKTAADKHNSNSRLSKNNDPSFQINSLNNPAGIAGIPPLWRNQFTEEKASSYGEVLIRKRRDPPNDTVNNEPIPLPPIVGIPPPVPGAPGVEKPDIAYMDLLIRAGGGLR